MPTMIVDEDGVEIANGDNILQDGTSFLVPRIRVLPGRNLVQNATYHLTDADHPGGLTVVLVHLPGAGMNTATFQ